MSEAAEILVIILSVVLSVFLLIGIILGIYLVKLTAEIRKIARSAQDTVDTLGVTIRGVAKIVSPMFIAKTVGDVIKKWTGKSRKGA